MFKKSGYKISTYEEIQEMRKMYQEGLSFSEIGRKFKKDHTVPMYHIKRSGDIMRKSFMNNNRGKAKTLIVLEDKKRDEERIKEFNPSLCFNCQGPKEDSRWRLTHFCSLKCWDAFVQPKRPVEYWYKSIKKL